MQTATKKYFNGPAIIAAMFREIDPVFRKALSEKIKTQSPILLKAIELLQFQYTDIARLDAASMQYVLQSLPERDWLVSWKLTPQVLRDRLLTNMSARRREAFECEFAALPRMPKIQVIKIQMQLAKQVEQLLEQGKIRICSRQPLKEYRARFVEKLRQRSQARALKAG